MESTTYQTFRQGVAACLPTVLGYVGIGIACGVVGKSVGLAVWQIAMMSILIYAGSAQFIICGMIALQAPVSAIIFTTFLVNLRHFLMSMSVAPYFRSLPLKEGIAIGTLLTDESYGVLVLPLAAREKIAFPWVQGLNFTAYLAWICATILGGLLGNWLPDPHLLGLDFALTGMFIGLLVLQATPALKQQPKVMWVMASVALSLYGFMYWFSPEMSVILATLIGCGVGVVMEK